MVIYADVLIFVNFIVDFLLLKLVSRLNKRNSKLWRFITASIAASLFSLYIFLPSQAFIIELLMRLGCSAVTVLICFGFKGIKSFLRNISLFYAVSFIFAGIILFLQSIRPSSKIGVNNGFVYFDISPTLLITLSFIIYIIITVIKRITQKTAEASERYTVKLSFFDKNVTAEAIFDSGHSLKDAFDSSLVIIIDANTANRLFGCMEVNMLLELVPPETEALKRRFRLIPVKTGSGEKMLPAVKLDTITVQGKNSFESKNPVAVISKEKLGDDFSVILPVL